MLFCSNVLKKTKIREREMERKKKEVLREIAAVFICIMCVMIKRKHQINNF